MTRTHMVITPGHVRCPDPMPSAHVHAKDCDHTADYVGRYAAIGVDITPRADLANRVADRCEHMHGRRPLEVIVCPCIGEAVA